MQGQFCFTTDNSGLIHFRLADTGALIIHGDLKNDNKASETVTFHVPKTSGFSLVITFLDNVYHVDFYGKIINSYRIFVGILQGE